MKIEDIERYTKTIIPNIELELQDSSKSTSELLELYNVYKNCLVLIAPHDFVTYNKYLEFNEDKTEDHLGFYHKRKHHLTELFNALNDMEIYDKYDTLMVSMPPRVGKSVTNLRFISWIMGRKPTHTQLAISYSDAITKSFYVGVMGIITSQEFIDVFPNSMLVAQNAKDENIWLSKVGQYPTISFIPIEGSMTGRGQGTDYIFFDDLISGIEQATSPSRLDKLWELYTTNSRQRKLKGCKEIHIATRWSVHDPMTKLEAIKESDDRFKSIKLPCYDENGNSAFDFQGGFDTNYYKDMESLMDDLSFGALYKCDPIEREGLLYHEDDLQYFFELPNDVEETTVAICDSKNMGADYVSSICGKVYGDTTYITDIVYNNGLPEVTRPLVADMWVRNSVVRADVELNNGGQYYDEDLDELVKSKGGKTSIRIFYSGNNKNVKIITYSDYAIKHFVFRHPSTYSPNSDYAKFMKDLFKWTQTGKNKHDDAPDSFAMLSQMIQELQGNVIKFLNRKRLGI